VLQKSGGCFFFKSETALHRAAHVHEQAQLDRQIGLAAEVDDGFDRLLIVENREIVLVQIADEFAVAISSDEQHVDFIDALRDGEDWIVCRATGGGKSSGVASAHRGGNDVRSVRSCLSPSRNRHAENGGGREYDECECSRCQSEFVALRHSFAPFTNPNLDRPCTSELSNTSMHAGGRRSPETRSN